MIEFNLNACCYVQLTDIGRQELKRQHDELNEFTKGKLGEYRPVAEDEDGWSKWQIYALMNQLGHMLVLGGDLPFNTTIKLDV